MNKKTQELDTDEFTYNDYVQRLANSNSSELISNGHKNHAKILIQQLLLKGNESVRIFSSHLKDVIYSDADVVAALRLFLSRKNTVLKILLQSPEQDPKISNREFFKICNESRNCDIRAIRDSEHKKLRTHFVTMDDRGYRFCADKDQFKAVASFNRPITTSNLNNQFDYLYSFATNYPPSNNLINMNP